MRKGERERVRQREMVVTDRQIPFSNEREKVRKEVRK